MKQIAKFLSLALFGVFAWVGMAVAQSGIADARILSGWRTAEGDHVTALHVTLNPGWKTYWRSPGDAGIPPRFDWNGSGNLARVGVEWPAPRRMDQGGVMTIGYADALVLPLRLTPQTKGQPISLTGVIEMGVCKDICVPVTLRLSQVLSGEAGKRDPRIVAALAERPYSAREAGVSQVTCQVSAVEDGIGLRAEIVMPKIGEHEYAAIETSNPEVWVAQAETVRQGDRLITETTMYHVEGRAFALDRSSVRITVLGRAIAVDIQGCSAG